jgi:hypothetical protein
MTLFQKSVSMSIGSSVSRELKSVHAFAIRLVTGEGFCNLAPYNHSFVVFNNVDCIVDDVPCRTVYFESWFRKNPETGKTGIQGPIPFQELIDWKNRKPKKRDFYIQQLPYPPVVVSLAYEMANSLVGKVGYANHQIFHNFKRGIFGLGSLPKYRTPEKMTCSEYAAWVWKWAAWFNAVLCGNEPWPPEVGCPVEKYLEVGLRNVLDDVVPSGQIGLYEAVEEFLATWRRINGLAEGYDR